MEAFREQEEVGVREKLYVPGGWRVRHREGVMGAGPGVQQGQSVKDSECHANGLGVDKLHPEARSSPLFVIINKVLLEHKHTHSLTHRLLFSCDSRVE